MPKGTHSPERKYGRGGMPGGRTEKTKGRGGIGGGQFREKRDVRTGKGGGQAGSENFSGRGGIRGGWEEGIQKTCGRDGKRGDSVGCGEGEGRMGCGD